MANISDKRVRKIIFDKYNGRCAYCGCELGVSFTIDHIEPKFRGFSNTELKLYNRDRGLDTIDNYNPCCFSCNSSKSTLTIDKWRSEINKKYDRLMKNESSFNLLVRMGMIIRNDNCVFYFEKI